MTRTGDHPILPGAAIGVLGSGQLGRMFAIAARRLGYRVHTFSPDSDTPTGQVSDLEVHADYADLDAVRRFAAGVKVLTFEFENVPAGAVEAAAELVPVRPAGAILHTTQHRLREKSWLALHGFPVVPFRPIATLSQLEAALEELGVPAVLKTAGFGYDGKGQVKITRREDAAAVWASVAPVGVTPVSAGSVDAPPGMDAPFVLEAWVEFAKEISVVAARGLDGSFCHWGAVENEHRNHILDLSVAPASVPPETAAAAVEIARGILEQLGVVGVLCVEFFLAKDGRLMVNELAPRPHNSGHFTFDAAVTSQFEQQLRAVCGLPLGSTRLLCPSAMVNLLGDLWANGEPNFAAAAAIPEVKLHLYGKVAPRPGRKMGHLTALADTPEKARKLALAARAALTRTP